MLRCLVRNFQRTLTLQLQQPKHVAATTVLPHLMQHQQCLLLHHTAELSETPVLDEVNAIGNLNEADYEYIVPYRTDHESCASKQMIIDALRSRYRLSPADVKGIFNDETVNRVYKQRSLINTLELLAMEGVTKKSFIEYPWLLTLEKSRLQQKISLLGKMPMQDINHFVAFLRLSVARLRKLVTSLARESNTLPQENRVYYISERLQTNAGEVTKYLVHRLFILEMPFDMLEQNMNIMLEYQVSPANILRDLWAFRYMPKSIKLRLERAKRAKKDKIMPWMVRCPEPILQRSLKLSLDEEAVLGGKASAVEYVAERLQFDVEEARAIMARHPSVMRVRVTKIKEVLDYLLDEAGFNRHEIAQTPRILCHSLETTKQRLTELKSYGCRPSTLVIVCRSKREYEKFVQYWVGMQQKYKKGNNDDMTDETITATEQDTRAKT